MTIITPVDQVSPGKLREVIIAKTLTSTRRISIKNPFRPVVALDIDGVMADFNAAMKPFSNVKDTEESCPHSYNFVESKWFNTFDDFERAHVTVMDSAGDIPLNDDTASEAVSMLQHEGCEVIAVTARREAWRKETLRFFQVNGIPITSERLFFMDKSNKSDMHFDYLIDDAPKNIVDALENTNSMPFVYAQPYNAHLPVTCVGSMMDFANAVIDHRKSLLSA